MTSTPVETPTSAATSPVDTPGPMDPRAWLFGPHDVDIADADPPVPPTPLPPLPPTAPRPRNHALSTSIMEADPPVPPTPLPPLPPGAPRPPRRAYLGSWDRVFADPPVPPTPLPPLPPSAPKPRNHTIPSAVTDADPPVPPTPLPPLPPLAPRPRATYGEANDADPPVPPTPLPPLPPSAPRPRNAPTCLPDLNKALPTPPGSPRVPPHPHPPAPPEAPQPVRVQDELCKDDDRCRVDPASFVLRDGVAGRLWWLAPPRPTCPRPRPSPGGPPPSPVNEVFCDGHELEEGTTCRNAVNGWCEIRLVDELGA